MQNLSQKQGRIIIQHKEESIYEGHKKGDKNKQINFVDQNLFKVAKPELFGVLQYLWTGATTEIV